MESTIKSKVGKTRQTTRRSTNRKSPTFSSKSTNTFSRVYTTLELSLKEPPFSPSQFLSSPQSHQSSSVECDDDPASKVSARCSSRHHISSKAPLPLTLSVNDANSVPLRERPNSKQSLVKFGRHRPLLSS